MYRSRIVVGVMTALTVTAAVQATTWVADFTSVAPETWEGSDAAAVAAYVDTDGNNPNVFTVTFNGATGLSPGWLTQGDRGGVPTTAKFWNPAGDGKSGRARFSTNLPSSMDANGGISFGWTARYGNYAMARAPIQIAVTDTGLSQTEGGVEYTVYLNVQNGTTLRVQQNGGGFYSTIEPLTIPNVGDGQYHQWSCAVITSGGMAHWKLWLDGTLLLFGGTDGAHLLNGEQFSFQTATNDFSGDPYIGLGDLQNTDIWDFEFDCVTYKDDGLEMLTCGIVPTCDSIVTPTTPASSTALRGSPADPLDHTYTITNGGTTALTYTVVEMQKAPPAIASLYNTGVDNSRAVLGMAVQDPHWTLIQGGLAGECTEGTPCPAYTIPAGANWLADDSNARWITAGQTENGNAPPGDHTFRTTFTLADAAAVAAASIRGRMAYDDTLVDVKLNGVVVVPGSAASGANSWTEFAIDSGFQVGTNTLDFTIRNSGTDANAMGLRVEFYDIVAGDVPWLALDKTGGTITTEGGSDTVTASIVSTDLPGGTHTAYVGIIDGCNPPAREIRRIDLTVIDCRSAVTPEGKTGRAFRVGSAQAPAPVVYTFENTGAPPVTYTVTSDAAWLQLDKSGGGPIPPGGSDAVTATIDPTGLAPGGYVATLTFTDGCDPATQHIRQVFFSVDENIEEGQGASQQFNAEFTQFTGTDLMAVSPVESCDPAVATTRTFAVAFNDVGNLVSDWLTQGEVDGVPTTAKFYNPADGLRGRVRFRTHLPFDESFDPIKGMAVAWSMKVASDDTIVRGPIQITFPRVTGPFGQSDTESSVAGEVFNVFIRVQNGTDIQILNNGGSVHSTIGTYTLSNSIADTFHQWTAAVCYNPDDQMAYWNLWVDGEKIMFTGTNGSVPGPQGDVFSFRTNLENVSGDPYIGLGELGSGEDLWNFEFDWVRMLSYKVTGCPFWDGESCIPVSCNTPFADADGDGDVDMDDFAIFQRCVNVGMAMPQYLGEQCHCFDRNKNRIVGDSVDLSAFAACGSGADVQWTPSVGCP
ncbi:MAG TPA: hypothetical protein PLT93_03855 [Phycisphaerae bacterium]|nr:hypothetical protein [Phycisphaerae bacterium]